MLEQFKKGLTLTFEENETKTNQNNLKIVQKGLSKCNNPEEQSFLTNLNNSLREIIKTSCAVPTIRKRIARGITAMLSNSQPSPTKN